MYRVTGSLGLANLHITSLSTLHPYPNPLQIWRVKCGERKRFELLRLLHSVCFQDSSLDQPESLHGVSGCIRNYSSKKETALQTVTSLRLRRTHLTFIVSTKWRGYSGNRMIRTFIRRLTDDRSAIELCFRSSPSPFFGEGSGLRCRPGEIRTHNSRCKRPVLLSN